MGLPDGLVLSYYGDDFTGSTDVMEVLSFAGVKTVLFMAPPSAAQIARFPGAKAVGVAGRTRSMSPEEMADELLPVYRAFRALKTPISHYKTCSTFDSSPEVGSIGRAIDLGQPVFDSPFVPLVVGAPQLRRYCAFGNLFARSGLDGDVFRLDRHPTMRRHPITPMDEADLRVHLSRQTARMTALFDVAQLELGGAALEGEFAALMAKQPEVVLFDVLCEAHLEKIGRLIWGRRPLFAAGSSGVEYALVAHWRKAGAIGQAMDRPVAGPVEQTVVVSGSCSPVTANQIAWAEAQGFETVALDPVRLIAAADAAVAEGVKRGVEILKAGRSAILHTGRGPEDGRIAQTVAHLKEMGFGDLDVKLRSGAMLGAALGRILQGILAQVHLKRAATTGGDTSYYIAQSLGIEALEVVAPMAPGSPLCRIHSGGRLDGTEIVFKGGQVGKVDFFGSVLSGRA